MAHKSKYTPSKESKNGWRGKGVISNDDLSFTLPVIDAYGDTLVDVRNKNGWPTSGFPVHYTLGKDGVKAVDRNGEGVGLEKMNTRAAEIRDFISFLNSVGIPFDETNARKAFRKLGFYLGGGLAKSATDLAIETKKKLKKGIRDINKKESQPVDSVRLDSIVNRTPQSFRDSLNHDYAEKLRLPWKVYEALPAIPKPKKRF